MSGSIDKEKNHGLDPEQLKRHEAVRNARSDIEEIFIRLGRIGNNTKKAIVQAVAEIRRAAQVLQDKVDDDSN